MNILVMGGTGWLGHNIVQELQKQEYPVTILTRGQKQTFGVAVRGVRII